MARDRGNRSAGDQPKNDKKGDSKKDPKQQTGTQTTWAAFFDDRFDKLEPWMKVVAVIAVVFYGFKNPRAQAWGRARWDDAKFFAKLYVDLCREDGGPVSHFFRTEINPRLVAVRQRIQAGRTRDRANREQWRQLYRRNRIVALFYPRRPNQEVNPNG